MSGMDVNQTSPADLGDQLEQLARRQQQFDRHLARQLRVDAAGLATMDQLMRSDAATPTELARRVGISTAAMTLVLDRLELAAHVTREPHPTDRRKVLVTPAADSVRSAHDVVEPLIRGVEELVAALDAHDRTVVSDFLAGVVGIFDAVLDDPASGD